VFRPVRRSERQLSVQEAYKILEKGQYGVLSTWDGEFPYCVPVNYVFIDGYIYFHTALDGHKVDSIKNYPKVCFNVVAENEILAQKLSTKYESVTVFGRAEFADGEEKKQALRNLVKKLAPGYENEGEKCILSMLNQTGVVRISIDYITAKANRGK